MYAFVLREDTKLYTHTHLCPLSCVHSGMYLLRYTAMRIGIGVWHHTQPAWPLTPPVRRQASGDAGADSGQPRYLVFSGSYVMQAYPPCCGCFLFPRNLRLHTQEEAWLPLHTLLFLLFQQSRTSEPSVGFLRQWVWKELRIVCVGAGPA